MDRLAGRTDELAGGMDRLVAKTDALGRKIDALGRKLTFMLAGFGLLQGVLIVASGMGVFERTPAGPHPVSEAACPWPAVAPHTHRVPVAPGGNGPPPERIPPARSDRFVDGTPCRPSRLRAATPAAPPRTPRRNAGTATAAPPRPHPQPASPPAPGVRRRLHSREV